MLQNIELHVNSWLEFKLKDSPISTLNKNNCQNKFFVWKLLVRQAGLGHLYYYI